MTPLISVIVPAYNVALYLAHCLDTILNQTYPKLEIVVVDDGATDGSDKIASEYAEKYPDRIIFIHTENRGVTSARLTGIAAAHGEWIGFVDGDDEIEPDMYDRLIRNALAHHADISHCGYQTIVNNGERFHYFYNSGRIIEQNHDAGVKDLLEGTFVEPGIWNKLFKRQLFNGLQEKMDLSLRVNEDLVMNFLLFSNAENSVYEDFCPYHYMSRGASVTRTEFREYKYTDPIRATKYILEHCSGEVMRAAQGQYLRACFVAVQNFYPRKECKQKYREIKQELLKNKNYWDTMGQRENKKMKFFLLAPELYYAIYVIYTRYFQRKVYE